jgi:pimeloyl-ACP methyl ester carboxylesterase
MRRRPAWPAAAALAAVLTMCAPAGAVTHGSIVRPLDPARPHGRTIRVHFDWYAPRSEPAGRPLVAVEGGPGYPTTGSSVEYRGIFGPLVHRRGLLLVDNRGTGSSARIGCRGLQSFSGRASGSAFARRVGRCARTIDAHFGPHASDLFSTAYAVDDLAAVIRRRHLAPVDLYGDSYGTYFVQSFIARHPKLLHAVVLDSAYPAHGTDPWYASSGETARLALDAVCARAPSCPPGATARLAALLDQVRARPIAGATRDADGSVRNITAGPRALADLAQDSGYDPIVLRELDPSVRAALAGDTAPLLRLVAQTRSYDHGTSPAGYFSDGLYMAVNCTDLPQLFSLGASPDRRRAQLAAALGTAPDAFGPFTPREWLTISGYSQPYDVCLDWPQPIQHEPAIPADAKPVQGVPILIAGGDLDSLTPLGDAPAYAAELGDDVTIVTLANTVHVTSEGDTPLVAGRACARAVIRSFLRGRLDAGCAPGIPPIHTADYPLRLSQATPAELVSGPDPGVTVRRAVTVAVDTAVDATIRLFYSGARRGPGLRGGHFIRHGQTIAFSGVRFTQDAPVNGTVHWNPTTGALAGTVHISGAGVDIEWSQSAPRATAVVRGAGLSLPAP